MNIIESKYEQDIEDIRLRFVLTAKMEEGIAGSDMGEESVAKALAFGGALHEAGNVSHVQEGRNFAEKRRKH